MYRRIELIDEMSAEDYRVLATELQRPGCRSRAGVSALLENRIDGLR